ncbi:serine hydrolase [Patescibacteria group bacterium]|nr:serine hydrolase [Patescibacteria group bacterium]
MLAKSLITVLLFLNPFSFLLGQPIPLTEEKVQLNKWDQSLLSSLWFANPNFLPIRDWNITEPEVEAKAALVFNLDKNKILYQKNINQVLPIASLTKLMTALIVLENIDLEEIAIISEQAIATYGDIGGLVVKEEISVKNLLYVLLMESSNDAAAALAEITQQKTNKNFIDLMNQKAEKLRLKNTNFIDSSGYDSGNVSTVEDIAQLVEYSFSQPIIWEIMRTPVIDLFSADGKINHHWVNTDELLNRLPNIVGGKTGYTEEAQGCLILVIETNNKYLITIVLGAQERFLQTERLINWVQKAYRW